MAMITEVFGDVVVLHTTQDLNETMGVTMREQLRPRNNHKVVVDLDATERVENAGLESLLNLQDTLRHKGGDVRVSVANPSIRKILEITRLDQQLEVYDCIIDAVRSYD
ncbi:MAG: STAS domain-containing protein [Planctomycetales bacterium]|nr:STAS domain-containing protein [Planctomycetales bacterium]